MHPTFEMKEPPIEAALFADLSKIEQCRLSRASKSVAGEAKMLT
jgi:hypothetical protein